MGKALKGISRHEAALTYIMVRQCDDLGEFPQVHKKEIADPIGLRF